MASVPGFRAKTTKNRNPRRRRSQLLQVGGAAVEDELQRRSVLLLKGHGAIAFGAGVARPAAPEYAGAPAAGGDLLERLGGHRLEIALGGHLHASESLALDTTAGRVRFHQAAAVVGPSDAPGLQFVSGATLYSARDGHVDDGVFLPLDSAGP
jgi:hypothetical protein